MLKSYPVGSIFTKQASSKVAETKDGLYVKRALSGVLNKLLDEVVTIEVQKVVKKWASNLYENQGSIKKGEDFLKELVVSLSTAASVSGNKATGAKGQRGGKPKAPSKKVPKRTPTLSATPDDAEAS